MSFLPDPGDRIELVALRDDYSRLQPGATGTVTRVTEEPWPSVGVRWDDGSSLSLLPDEGDAWRALVRDPYVCSCPRGHRWSPGGALNLGSTTCPTCGWHTSDGWS